MTELGQNTQHVEMRLHHSFKKEIYGDVILEQPSSNKIDFYDTELFSHENKSLMDNLQLLVKLYKKRMGDRQISVISGGLQQFINKRKTTDVSTSSPGHRKDFSNLPLNVKLLIFSYLNPSELCQACRVCREWYMLMQDNIMWKHMLHRDKMRWNVISHCTNPHLYEETKSELSAKEIYLRCSPEVNNMIHKQYNMVTNFTNILRYFIPKKTPRIAMFGPGLESQNTSQIARNLLSLDDFQNVGFVPGFEGVGSGATFKRKSTGSTFTLSLLYSASKQEREQTGRDRSLQNQLIQQVQNEEGQMITVLKPAVRSFCQMVDAFVFVIDGTKSAHAVSDGKAELEAMLQERWSASFVPVLILSCVKDTKTESVSCYDICQELQLSTLNRPWQVRQCDSECKTGVCDGLQWLVEQSKRQYS